MNRISDIISTPVISLYESEYIGIIYNILFDYRQKKCKYACILDEKENILKVIQFADIYKIGKECIFIKNLTVVGLQNNFEKELDEHYNPNNLKVYTLSGDYLGTSNDISIDDNFNMMNFILGNGIAIDIDKVINIGSTVILVDEQKINISKFRPRQKIIKNNLEKDSKVMILSDYIDRENTTPLSTQSDSQQTFSNSQNTKIITDFRFLVGRILSQDVKAINGEIIAKHGSIITKDIVNRASFYGKLVEIARYSK